MSNSGSITNLTAALVRIDLQPPKAVTEAIALAEKANAAAASIAPPPAALLGAAIAAAVLAGRDPAADKEVQRLRTLESISPMAAPSVRAWGEAHVVATLTEHADTMLETWRAASVTAGEALTAAFDLVGDTELSDSEAFLRRGPRGAEAWANARSAVDRLKALGQAWSSLAALTRVASDGGYPVLRLADLDAATLDKVGRTADAWTIVRAGARIEIADRTTMPQRLAHIADGRQARVQHQVDEYQAAVRRPFAIK